MSRIMSFKGIIGYNRDDLHIQIIDYRQFLHFLPIYCELSDNLKKDFLLLLYHTQSHLSTPERAFDSHGAWSEIL